MSESASPVPVPQQALMAHFLPAMRQRFKAEVNRLTSGAMAQMLRGHADAAALAFPLTYLYAFHWLRENLHEDYRSAVLSAFRGRPDRAVLMDLLEHSADAQAFLEGYIRHWRNAPAGGPVQREQLLSLLAAQQGDPRRLVRHLLAVWDSLGLFTRTRSQAYGELAREERARYRGMLSEPDRERLALVDALPERAAREGDGRFAKLGIIPAMGCPQTCRHCMFIWRPPMGEVPDTADLYALVDRLTDSVLFTGGDLTRHLAHFHRAIRDMPHVRTFAILLNGDFARDRAATRDTLEAMEQALASRPVGWAEARVLLQISFDELHQEILVDKQGALKERIPVGRIANIVEGVLDCPRIQLCLVHKQNTLSFSTDLFRKGAFGRLATELGHRGHQVQVLDATPSPRLKRHPLDPRQSGQVVKDASFVLARHPECPILFTSSTVDGYGRATLLDPGEAVQERDLLRQVLAGQGMPGEGFDTDLMFWHNGWVTLFSAVHLCLGDLYRDGAETILRRHRLDPLSAALRELDLRLLGYYGEIRPDLEARLAAATGPHHLFHTLTEEAEVRLHMTRRLLGV
jgi:hypothetical protein